VNGSFAFRVFDNVIAGTGVTRDLGTLLDSHGYRRVVVLADEGVASRSVYFRDIEARIRPGREVEIQLLRGSEEPDYDYLDEVAGRLRAGARPDALVGIGGGSAMDVTKAAAVLLTNPGRGIEYRGFDKVAREGVPTICIPTTAGSGSEVTINAVFTDKSERKKLGINGRFMNATQAVLDAEWTASCPYAVALSSGMDALTHTLESFSCRQQNAMTRVFSTAAFGLLWRNLPALKNSSCDSEQRQRILLGAHLAAIALFNAGSGIAGALSYPIGVHYKVPHGIGGAVFLASVVEFNVEAGYTDYADLLDQIEPHPGWTAADKSRRFADAFREFSTAMGVPPHLNEWGITRENVDDVAALMRPLQAAFDQNPVAFAADRDAAAMLRRHVRSA